MLSFHALAAVMVLVGALFMAAAIRTCLRVSRSVPAELSQRWTVITSFLLFFLFGYGAFLLLQQADSQAYLELVTGAVFLGGAIFVFLMINLVRRTVRQLRENADEIARINEKLLDKALDLEDEIKERQQTEKALRESRNLFENIFNSSIPLVVTNLDHEIELANESYFQVFGRPSGNLPCQKCYESRPGDTCHTEDCPLVLVQQGREEVMQECSKEKANGRRTHYIATARPFRDADGTLAGIAQSFQDITRRKEAETLLATEKERLAITLQSIGDGVITTDLKGRVVLINEVAELLTGWNAAEAVGRPLAEIFELFTDDRQRLEDPLVRALRASDRAEERHAILIARDGWERFIDASASPIFNENSLLSGAVLVIRDVTERSRLEDEMAKMDKLKSIGLLAGGIAHDFNNLLTAIIGNIALVKMRFPEDQMVLERLAKAEEAVLKAKDLTQQLITFSKGGAPIKRPLALAPLIRETVSFALQGSRTECELLLADDLWPVEGDSAQLSQVLSNLIINADQAMPDGGILRLSAANVCLRPSSGLTLPPGNYIRVEVTDEGRGIPKENLPLIFDPYFTTKPRGTGLGLATVYSIISRHGGHIGVDSAERRGTTFTIHLPATAKADAGRAEPASGSRTVSGQGDILVMDDNEDILEIAGLLLEDLGYSVSFARDGGEAVAAYRQRFEDGHPFAAVILDLTIPGGMGGRETVEHLKAIDPKVKAIVSSGYSSDPVMASFRDYGFCGVARKPYKIEELSLLLGELLASRKGLSGELTATLQTG